MKLKTDKGELSLPNDFAFEVETTNPAFSDEGDATVPATLPASNENMRLLGYAHRIDRSSRFMKRIPATLSAGAYFKKGQLIVDTIDKNNGIDVSFAIENSDIYSQVKNTGLKEIFKNKVRNFNSVNEIISLLTSIYHNAATDDFTIFPIAVSSYEDDAGKVIYQYSNQMNFRSLNPPTGQLVYEARTVVEDGCVMSVPKGYGVSPFLFLHRMIDILFSLIGYDVVENCFSSSDLKDIVLLNNCADTIVEGYIDYSDLVPSCTVSQFIQFLQDKFNVVIRVDSTKMQVRAMSVSEVIGNKEYDIDITDITDDDSITMEVDETCRVSLSSRYFEGGEPAAKTLDELIGKYGYCVAMEDGDFNLLKTLIESGSQNAQCHDCLIYRSYTGGFYELQRSLKDGRQLLRYIGTSNFTYDRNNSREIETHSSDDNIPLTVETEDNMLRLYCYVGERLHSHTKVKFKTTSRENEQEIMVCWNHKGFGSITAKFLGEDRPFDLTPYGMYSRFWSGYNDMLLNNRLTLRAKVIYPKTYLLNLDMTKKKIYKNQLLLPVKTTYNVSSKISNGMSEFILIKEYFDGITDENIEFFDKQPSNSLVWHFDDSKLLSQAEEQWQWYKERGLYVDKKDGHFVIPEPWPDDPYKYFVYNCLVLLIPETYTVERKPTKESAFIGPPSFEGEISYSYMMPYEIIVNYVVCNYNIANSIYVPTTQRRQVRYSKENYKAEVNFIAVKKTA